MIASPLIIVGAMIIGTVRDIDWKDPTEAIPAFLTIIVMPLAVSITEGVAFGVVALCRPETGHRPRPRRCTRCCTYSRCSSSFVTLFLRG